MNNNGRGYRNGRTNGANGYDASAEQKFTLIPFDKISMSTRRAYLIKGIVPREGLVVLWGPPKCGKSFLTLDMVMHVALGWEYRGRRVAAGTVVYVACEGEQGLSARIEAFRQDKLQEASAPPFFLVTTRLDLARDAQQLVLDIGFQVASFLPEPTAESLYQNPVCIVIDTLNRSLAGSESKDEDMAAYVQGADYLRSQFNCAVILIHHCGINDARPRGHSSLTGAADAQIKVVRDQAGQVVLTVEWMKDGPEGDTLISKLRIMDLGFDEDGEAVTSCVIEGGEPIPAEPRGPKLKPDEQIALEKLHDCLAREGAISTGSHFPPNAYTVTTAAWQQACKSSEIMDLSHSAGRMAWKRLKDKLQAIGKIGIYDGHVWAIRKYPSKSKGLDAASDSQDLSWN